MDDSTTNISISRAKGTYALNAIDSKLERESSQLKEVPDNGCGLPRTSQVNKSRNYDHHIVIRLIGSLLNR